MGTRAVVSSQVRPGNQGDGRSQGIRGLGFRPTSADRAGGPELFMDADRLTFDDSVLRTAGCSATVPGHDNDGNSGACGSAGGGLARVD